MKELDFLPQIYHHNIRRRMQTRRNVLMCAGLGVAMVCLHGLNLTRISGAQAALADLRNGSGGWQTARSELAAMEAQRGLCRGKLDLINRLEDAAPLDAAVGEVTSLMSESMALTAVHVESGTTEASPAGKTANTAIATPPTTRVRLTGVAATDVEVGIFLGKLSGCPLFADVTLCFSRDTRAQGRKMREFEVKFILRPVEESR